jgi:hypothetical protein
VVHDKEAKKEWTWAEYAIYQVALWYVWNLFRFDNMDII